jgi:hypothetical protein
MGGYLFEVKRRLQYTSKEGRKGKCLVLVGFALTEQPIAILHIEQEIVFA